MDFSRLLHPLKKMAGKMFCSQFPVQNTVAEHFWQALVALQYQGRIFQFGCSMHMTLEYLQMGTHSSGVSSHRTFFV